MAVIRTRATANPADATVEATTAVPAAHAARDGGVAADARIGDAGAAADGGIRDAGAAADARA
jgi:hypothetical protein